MQTVNYNDLVIGTIYLCLRKDGDCYYIVFSERNGNKHYGEQVSRNGQFISGEHRPGLIRLYSHSQYYAINSEYERTFNQVQNGNTAD